MITPLCFPSVSNLQDGGEAVKDDRKSNCHHKKASVITFRPRFRLEGNTRLIYRLDGTHSQRVEPPSTHSAFEARLNQSMQPSSSAVAAASQPASPSILPLQRSLAADLETTNFLFTRLIIIIPPRHVSWPRLNPTCSTEISFPAHHPSQSLSRD